jgi:hypothetical protein
MNKNMEWYKFIETSIIGLFNGTCGLSQVVSQNLPRDIGTNENREQ